MMSIRSWIKRDSQRKRFALWLMRVWDPLRPPNTFRAIAGYARFLSEYRQYRKAGGTANVMDWYPCLYDRTASTGFDTHYLYQAAWAAREIHDVQPARHVDVGSDLRFVTQLAAHTEVEFIDIRPPNIHLRGFNVRKGSILELPYPDAALASISSMHVIEHIGLGRYGDPILAHGPALACRELSRVLQSGGRAYVSVPIGRARAGFNGLYVFDLRAFPALFPDCKILKFAMVDTDGTFDPSLDYNTAQLSDHGSLDFGLGIYVLQKQ